jgi:lysophospholipase L1-like esterase
LRRLYGPGVVDVSRFNYMYHQCRNSTTASYVEYGYESLSWVPFPNTPPGPANPDRFVLDGIITMDANYYSTDLFKNSAINNVKILSWNGNNDGLEFGLNSSASNVFVRVGDDSLKMWGGYVNVNNATVWQNFNGGVVNLGWYDNSPGDGDRIDGVYVIKTDWKAPTKVSWDWQTLLGQLMSQNNAVVDSMMIPGTQFGAFSPPVFRNFYIEDTPQVLFSLKILPQDCGLPGAKNCPSVPLTLPTTLNLNIEHIFVPTPPSVKTSSIGFQNVDTSQFSGTLSGNMNIGLNDVELIPATGPPTTLNSGNARDTGRIRTNGSTVNIDYENPFQAYPNWYTAWSVAHGFDITDSAMANATVRMIVRPVIDSTTVRVRLENTEGMYPVVFSAAYIGKVQSGAALVSGSNMPLTFHGNPGLTLAPGTSAYSDPLVYPVTGLAQYAISLNVTSATDISAHRLGLVTNYMTAGAHAGDISAKDFRAVSPLPDKKTGANTYPFYWVAGLDVYSPAATGTVVALGDSITDGYCSTRNSMGVVVPDEYNRWTDVLAQRFAVVSGGKGKAVVNAGISGNTVAGDDSSGPQALVRMNNDVFSLEGVTHVILFEGTNDIGDSRDTAASVIAADEQLINRAHAAGIAIVGATIIPRGGNSDWTEAMEAQRLELNDWIRNKAKFDGVIDFDSIMQGPINKSNNSVTIPASLSCGDGLGVHPNAAGYAAMGAFVKLGLFSSP